MKLVVDANILFAALIKKSKTRKLLLEKNNLVTPEYVLHETQKYLPLIIEKSGMTKEQVEKLLDVLFSRITIISREELLTHAMESLEISKDIDHYDAPYFAAALATQGIIWSNDKVLKKQNKIIVMNTQELLRTIQEDS